jgi:hypothetical protein
MYNIRSWLGNKLVPNLPNKQPNINWMRADTIIQNMELIMKTQLVQPSTTLV